MKSFLKYTLASIVGFTVIFVIGIFIVIGIISAMVASTSKDVSIKDNSVLLLKLNEQVVDRAPNNPFQNMEIPGLSGTKQIGLDDIVSAIEKAKTEDKIKGIYLRIDDVMAGYSACEEIRNALIEFKESTDKFIYAYSEYYSQKGYYIASAADKVFINPEGMLIFSGISANRSFYKNALDKLGIEMQIIRHGKFKAAVEPFMLDKMSKENREQTEVYIGSIWNTVLKGISSSRSISINELNEIADENMIFRNTEVLLAKNLVDSIVYEDQILDYLRLATDTKPNKEINAHSVSDMKTIVTPRKEKGLPKNKIALIYGAGEIGMGDPSSYNEESISGTKLAKEIRKARLDTTINAIVFRINSPGGSALASDLIWREVKLARQVKPVVASLGNVAASGGYYIACSADTIVANPTTITGSIGVFGMIPNTQKLFEDKLGINTEVVKTNELSDLPSINRKMTATEIAIMQNMVEDVYSTFVNHVAEGRGLTFEQVDEIGQGRVWTGENAKELGLVDVLGDLNDAIKIAEEMAGLEHYRLIKLPQQKDPIEELLQGFSSKIKYITIERELGEAYSYYKAIENIKNSNGVMARIPFNFEIE